MKNILRVILMLFIVTFSMPIAFSEAEEYEFKFEVEHDFDDDEQIECDINYDDNTKTFRFDEDDSGDKLEFEKSFTDSIDIDCDENIDDITLQIFDQTGKKIFDEDYSREDKVKVDLDDFKYDEDEDSFSIEIEHDFGNDEIRCDLEIDGTDYDFKFDSDDSSDVLTIEKNFETIIKFTCDEEMDEIKLTVFDDDGDEEFEETYLEDDRISYDKDKEDMDSTEVIIDIEHDFGNDKISCDLEIDGDDYATYNFDEDSSSSDLKVAVDIKEEISFDCDDKFDEIIVRFYNEDGEKIETLEFKNEDEFEYEVSGGAYDWNFRIIHEFEEDEEIECELNVDNQKVLDVELDDSSRISDLMHDGNFDVSVILECDAELDTIEFGTYFDGSSRAIFSEDYTSTSGFDYVQLSTEEQKIIDDKKAADAAEEERRVAAENAAAEQAEELRVAEQKIADQKAEQARVAAAEKARLEKIELDKQTDLNLGVDSISGKVVEGEISGEVTEDGNNDTYWMVAAVVGAILLIIAVFSFVEVRPSASAKKSRGKTSHGFSHDPSRKVEQRTSTTSNQRNKVNFDFLDKRK